MQKNIAKKLYQLISKEIRTLLCIRLLQSLLIVGIFYAPYTALNAQAQDIGEEDPCDADFWESLKSKAWLEAQREVTQNQNLIFKPDSVMEYTCSLRFMEELADHAEDMFSETDRWGIILPPDVSMSNALTTLVGEAIAWYLVGNFGSGIPPDPPDKPPKDDHYYAMLGGRLNTWPPTNGSGLDYIPEGPVPPGSYGCSKMNEVWMEAKCMDFIDVPEEDGFFTFEQYMDDEDKRFLPHRCKNPKLAERWKDGIEKAYVDEKTPWVEDEVWTYRWRSSYLWCGVYLNGGLLTPPIETGLFIKSKEHPKGYKEKVCIPPGCFWHPNLPNECCSAKSPPGQCCGTEPTLGTCQPIP